MAFLSVCIQLSNSSFTPSPPIGERRNLVPEAADVQLEDPIAHFEPPPMYSDRREENVKEHTANIS